MENLFVLFAEIQTCLHGKQLERAKQGKGKVGLEEAAVLKLLMHDTHWTAGKLVPKVYGDKTQQQITGADDGPLQIKWED